MKTKTTAPDAKTGTTRMARSTLVVMAGMAASIVVGLFRQRIVASKFGTSAALDAYSAANGIPELLFTMLAGGALAFAFIPIYAELLGKERWDEANDLVGQVITPILLLAGTFAITIALIAPTLVSAPWGIGPHFPAEIQLLTAQIMRILLVSTIIFTASSILTGTLHAHQHFLLPALAPTMYSLGIIF